MSKYYSRRATECKQFREARWELYKLDEKYSKVPASQREDAYQRGYDPWPEFNDSAVSSSSKSSYGGSSFGGSSFDSSSFEPEPEPEPYRFPPREPQINAFSAIESADDVLSRTRTAKQPSGTVYPQSGDKHFRVVKKNEKPITYNRPKKTVSVKKEPDGIITKFTKNLTNDLFENGIPATPYDSFIGTMSAFVNAVDTIDRSSTEQNIRKVMSFIPVLKEIELWEKMSENQIKQNIILMKKDKEIFMNKGHTERAATALAIYHNDFEGDMCPTALNLILKEEAKKAEQSIKDNN